MYAMKNKKKCDQTATPNKYPQGYFKDKPCKQCGELFSPQAPSELYCSDGCKDTGLVNAYLKRKYGITVDDYNQMLIEQNHCCKICGSSGFKMKDAHKVLLVVDHNHVNGNVRGLLCHNCNRALGLLQDDIAIVRRCAEYLEGAETIPKGSTLK